jgi:hypothetical protein
VKLIFGEYIQIPSFATSCISRLFFSANDHRRSELFFPMASLADFLVTHAPFPSLPQYLRSYIPGETPLSTWPSVGTALVSYLAIIFGTRQIMKSRPPQKLNTFFRVHNVVLSAGSLILLVLMVEEMLPIIWNEGIFNAMCAAPSWTPVSGMAPRMRLA